MNDILKGRVVSGVMRGKPMVSYYYYRLINLLGFEPVKGTFDIRLEKPVSIKDYATKTIDERLMDGSLKIEAYLAPVELRFKGQAYETWAIRDYTPIHRDTLLEIVAKDLIKKKFGLNDGDEVEIRFLASKKTPIKGFKRVTTLLKKYKTEKKK